MKVEANFLVFVKVVSQFMCLLQELYRMKSGDLTPPTHDTIEYLTRILLANPSQALLLLSHLKSEDTNELLSCIAIDSLHRCASRVCEQ